MRIFPKSHSDHSTKNNRNYIKTKSFSFPDAKLLKSLKSRFNYASTSCSARILSTNPEAQGSASILAPSKDSYLRNSCSTLKKFVVVELCEEVRIDSIVLANYELFSSTFKRFKMYGAADKLHTDSTPSQILWKLLIEGEMQEDGPFLHSEQAFAVASEPQGQVFFKYLRIEFDDEYYGSEALCPVSILKVYGKTMLDEFNEELLQTKIVEDYLPVFASDVASSPELTELINEMTQLSSQITKLQLESARIYRNSTGIVDHQQCLKEEQALVDLKDRYSALESRSFILQSQSKSHGNVFKNLHDRLNKLETSLKQHPLNLILFRSRRNDLQDDDLDDPKLISDIPIPELTSLTDEISNLKADVKRIQSNLASQQLKLSILIVFNSLFVAVVLVQIIRRWIKNYKPTKNHPNLALRRRPLIELKSPSSSSSMIASTSTSNLQHDSREQTTPGVVLSEDEVLLYEE